MPYTDPKSEAAIESNRRKTGRYRKTVGGAAARRAVQSKYQAKNRHKANAHNAVYRALKKGLIVRPERCSDCGKHAKVEAHHDDYANQLDIKWLCNGCHNRAHGKCVG